MLKRLKPRGHRDAVAHPPGKPSNANLAYLAGKQEWSEQTGYLVSDRAHYRRNNIVAYIVIAVLAAVVAMLATRGSIETWVVEVDNLGRTQVVGRPGNANGLSEAELSTAFKEFVENARSVYSDRHAQTNAINKAYAFINANGPAFKVLTEFHAKSDPFARAETETVEVEVKSALPIAGRTWKVEWMERVRGRDGNEKSYLPYELTVTYTQTLPKEIQVLLANPRGIYIEDFRWTQRL